jgi:hypothetical protein
VRRVFELNFGGVCFMMHRSKKPLVSGDREYFNEKRPVNVRVEGTAHLAEALLSLNRPETFNSLRR